MNKLEALKAMCDGMIVESSMGRYYRLNEEVQIVIHWGLSNGWQEGYMAFKSAEFDGWSIGGHDWQWAIEQCDVGVKVRWYEWEAGEYMVLVGDNGHYYFSDSVVQIVMNKKYFTKRGWMLA